MWKILFAAVIALVLAGIAFVALRPEPVVRVETVSVERRSIENNLQLTGRVINDKTVTITALLDGEITAINAREGQLVARGDILASLDNKQAQAQLSKAAADLEYQQKLYSMVSSNYQRLYNLYKNGGGSKQAADDKLLQRRAAEASVKVAQAELSIRQLQLDNSRVAAPFDGTVTAQNAEIGQWVEAGTRLFEVVASDGNVIEIQVDAEDAGLVSIGQSVSLKSQASDKQWLSSVTWLAPAITKSDRAGSNAFAVRVALGDEAPTLLLNQQLDVELSIESVDNVVALDQRALRSLGPASYGVLLLQNNKVVATEISTGLFSLDYVEVTKGLQPGDTVIIPGRQNLRDGDSVEAH